MKKEYNIGKNKKNDILLKGEGCLDFHAKVIYDRGIWTLHNLEKQKATYVGVEVVVDTHLLAKDDIIKIGNQKIYWNDYLYEGETQEIRLKDLFTFHGRVSRANYRALSLLALGISICVFFLPSLIFKLTYRWTPNNMEISLASTESLMPAVYLICYPIILFVMLILFMKRIRDTGNPIWKLFLPLYNLKLLYVEFSKGYLN